MRRGILFKLEEGRPQHWQRVLVCIYNENLSRYEYDFYAYDEIDDIFSSDIYKILKFDEIFGWFIPENAEMMVNGM